MSFIFPQGARKFFQAIHGARDGTTKFIMFDRYYCCLMIGLDCRTLGSEADLEPDVFVNAYPEDYRPNADIIAGLLIDSELDRKGIRPEDKGSIEHEIVMLLNPTSPTGLSEAGNRLLNLYAVEGFSRIQDRMLPPANLEEFLVAYHQLWYPETTATI